MKHILFFILFFTAVTLSAQTEFSTKFRSIPAPKFSAKPKKLPNTTVKDPQTESLDMPPIKTPNVFDNTSITPKSSLEIGKTSDFSMVPKNEFANPGDRYVPKMEKDLDKALKEAGLKEDNEALVYTDISFGEIRTSSAYFIIKYRDCGQIDGDLAKATLNGNVEQTKLLMEFEYKQFKIVLKDGFNTFEIEALNKGLLGGNTAEFRIYDAEGKLLLSDFWQNLNTGVKAKFLIIKENDNNLNKGQK